MGLVSRVSTWYPAHVASVRSWIAVIAIYLAARYALSLWPVLSPEGVALLSLGIGVLAFMNPLLAVGVTLVGLVLNAFNLAGAFGAMMAVFFVLAWRAANPGYSLLRAVIFLMAPWAFQHGFILLPAVLAGIVLAENAWIMALVAGAFGLIVSWLAGSAVPGILPSHIGPVTAPLAVSLIPHWLELQATNPYFNVLSMLASRFVPYAASALGLLVATTLASLVAAALVRRRTPQNYLLATAAATVVGLAGVGAAAFNFHPSLAPVAELLGPALLGGAIAWVTGLIFYPSTAVLEGQEVQAQSRRSASERAADPRRDFRQAAYTTGDFGWNDRDLQQRQAQGFGSPQEGEGYVVEGEVVGRG